MKKVILKGIGLEVYFNPDNSSICREPTCKAQIFWARNPKTNRTIPISCDQNGEWSNHFMTCTKPNRF